MIDECQGCMGVSTSPWSSLASGREKFANVDSVPFDYAQYAEAGPVVLV
ncbi:MAG: hypothetical protein ACYC27_00435 [Armatimonadota bacterium]